VEKLNRKVIKEMIIQEAKNIKKERNKQISYIKENMLMEQKLTSQGYTQKESNQMLIREFFDAGSDSFKFMFIDWLVNAFGLDPNSFFAKTIKEIIENISMEEVSQFISGEGDRCDMITENIADGLIEAMGNEMIEYFTGTSASEHGVFSGVIREIVTNFIKDASVAESLKNSIKGVVCNFSFGDLFSFMTGGGSGSTNNQYSEDSAAASQMNQVSGLLNSLKNFIPGLD
jgi:hypothetical protein